MKKQLLLIAFILLLQLRALACDCRNHPPFNKVISFADLVVEVEITGYLTFKMINEAQMPLAAVARITTVLQGRKVTKTITIWGDDGSMCRPYINQFLPGRRYIMALKKLQALPGSTSNSQPNYYLDACGAYWLVSQKNTKVYEGDIDGKNKEMSLTLLRKKFFKT